MSPMLLKTIPPSNKLLCCDALTTNPKAANSQGAKTSTTIKHQDAETISPFALEPSVYLQKDKKN
ncbi:hypothetical protein P7K49_004957, partial [Saguinus oedipus]